MQAEEGAATAGGSKPIDYSKYVFRRACEMPKACKTTGRPSKEARQAKEG